MPRYPDLVAHTTDRADQRRIVAAIHLAAKVINVHVDYVRHGVTFELPNLFDNGRARNRLAHVAHQEFKQSKFLGAEINSVPLALDGVGDLRFGFPE